MTTRPTDETLDSLWDEFGPESGWDPADGIPLTHDLVLSLLTEVRDSRSAPADPLRVEVERIAANCEQAATFAVGLSDNAAAAAFRAVAADLRRVLASRPTTPDTKEDHHG